MAVCFRGYLLQLAANPRFSAPLAGCLEHAQSIIDESRCNPRECAHLEALINWREDRAGRALELLESVLEDHPDDMLALRIAHYLHFYNGHGEQMRDSIARVMPVWKADHPHYGYLLGMYAFGLEESADYPAAERMGREAVERNATDIWATHAVTHIFQMQGRHREGIDWLASLKDGWSEINNFRNHVVWHQALHWLGLSEPARALAIYDEQLMDSLGDDFYLDLCNNAALLWRLEFVGLDVGDRWEPLAAIAKQHTADRELLFASLHYLIPLATTHSPETGDLVDTIRSWGESDTDQGRICAEVGIALADAVSSAGAHPLESQALLKEADRNLFQIGGSKAQRDLFHLLADNCASRVNHIQPHS